MSPRISPSSMWNVTSSRAVSPPNLRVSASTSRMRLREAAKPSSCSASVSATRALLLVDALFEGFDLLLHPLGSNRASGWQQALRAEDRQEHQGGAEDQHAEL